MQYKECLTFTKETSCISANGWIRMFSIDDCVSYRYIAYLPNHIPLVRTSQIDLEGYPKLIGD